MSFHLKSQNLTTSNVDLLDLVTTTARRKSGTGWVGPEREGHRDEAREGGWKRGSEEAYLALITNLKDIYFSSKKTFSKTSDGNQKCQQSNIL